MANRQPMTRANYARLPAWQLESRLRAAEDRLERAETAEDSLADSFAIQEMQAAQALQGGANG